MINWEGGCHREGTQRQKRLHSGKAAERRNSLDWDRKLFLANSLPLSMPRRFPKWDVLCCCLGTFPLSFRFFSFMCFLFPFYY